MARGIITDMPRFCSAFDAIAAAAAAVLLFPLGGAGATPFGGADVGLLITFFEFFDGVFDCCYKIQSIQQFISFPLSNEFGGFRLISYLFCYIWQLQ